MATSITATATATATEPLKESLRAYPISQPAQNDVTRELWRQRTNGTTNRLSSTYFEFYAKRVRRHLLDGEPFCLQDHADVVWVGNMIIDDVSRNEMRQKLRERFINHDDDTIEDAIDLCASLLVMAEIKAPSQDDRAKGHGMSGRTPVLWDDFSLPSVLADHFVPQTKLEADNRKLGRVFTARNLSQMSGIEVKWTTNLADHLRLVDDDQAVFVFQGANFLQFQNTVDNSPLPKPLITETLDTLALLFPSTDKDTQAWLKTKHDKQAESSLTAPELDIGRCGALRTSQRRIENFSIWHDRLVILKQAFDESQPGSLSQWWFDRRNRVQWYTFWVAILVFAMTMVFGVVQSVEGGLQVYLTYKGESDG